MLAAEGRAIGFKLDGPTRWRAWPAIVQKEGVKWQKVRIQGGEPHLQSVDNIGRSIKRTP